MLRTFSLSMLALATLTLASCAAPPGAGPAASTGPMGGATCTAA